MNFFQGPIYSKLKLKDIAVWLIKGEVFFKGEIIEIYCKLVKNHLKSILTLHQKCQAFPYPPIFHSNYFPEINTCTEATVWNTFYVCKKKMFLNSPLRSPWIKFVWHCYFRLMNKFRILSLIEIISTRSILGRETVNLQECF